jgi:hypothetical protein
MAKSPFPIHLLIVHMHQTKIVENNIMVICTFDISTKIGTFTKISKSTDFVTLPEYQLPVFSPISVSVPILVQETSGIGISTDTKIPTTFLCPH